MKIDELKKNWDCLGRIDALGNILTDPMMRGKWTRDKFFKTGEEEIAALFEYLMEISCSPNPGRALDFGCGVGRLTQSLCLRFEECTGVDIAPSMIELAKSYNVHGARCQYVVNERDDLAIFENNSFDFIYSNIVLQHMDPYYAKKYIWEFVRILKPGGVCVFQIPSKRREAKVENKPVVRAEHLLLPDAAFRAHIIVLYAPDLAKPGERKQIRVKVRNLSEHTWPRGAMDDGRLIVNLGNHWLNADGKIAVFDDGRKTLSKALRPGEKLEVTLEVTAPTKAGRYILEVDLVQEGVAWFKDKGSVTARSMVAVEGKVVEGRENGQFCPKMEMYGIPAEELVQLVIKKGAVVKDVVEYNVSGEEWVSYRYCITK